MAGQLLAIDLFSGCGGLTLGLKRAGFTVIGAIDLDSLANDTYKANHTDVRLWETDIRNVSADEVRRKLRLRKGRLDVLAGCPPCQDFSSIRTLNGGRIVRNRQQKDLVYEVLRYVRGLRPKVVMFENVPGIVKDRRFAWLRNSLARLGYKCIWKVLDAASYGVPQRRRRLILLGSRLSKPNFAKPVKGTKTVKGAISSLPRPGGSGDPLHDVSEARSERIARLIGKIPKNGGSRRYVPRSMQLGCHRRCNGFKDVYGRMKWNDAAPTITGGCVNPSKGRFLHPEQDRAITLREAALLQSFPRSYYFSMRRGKYAAASLIGNALPPELIRRQAIAIGRHLRSHGFTNGLTK